VLRRNFLATLPFVPGALARLPGPPIWRAADATPTAPLPPPAVTPRPSHVVTLLEKPLLPPDFPYFPYVNPEAPKGGGVTLSAIGTFDNFNSFIVRGTAPDDIGRIYDTLLRADINEPSTAYGHLAESIEIAPDHASVAFNLRAAARFHDGTPVTAMDVVWTFDTLRSVGRPFYRLYYADIERAEAVSARRVVFHLKPSPDRELPLILGEMPVLPMHFWKDRDFSKPLTDTPLGSGPYRVEAAEFGRSLTYRRVHDYWALDLPTARGQFNFGHIQVEYFRDATVAFEAFKAGQVDFREENIAKQWATAYDFPALQHGLVSKENLSQHLPTGMQGFAMNTRRPIFQDRRVRQAMDLAFDFEWCNANLFYGAYTRTKSYFSNSDMASSGLPEGAELALLEPHRAQLPAELFTAPFTLPVNNASGNNRENLMKALALLKQAGWEVKERKLINQDGIPFTFEILLDEPAFERVSLPYVQWLAHLGIEARVRTVDPAQYQQLINAFNFDMTVAVFPQSDYPGNEQAGYWSSAAAKQEGSDNLMGVADPVVDALVGKVITAPDYDSLLPAVHALDRVLLWNWYMVPHWYLQSVRVAYWRRFGRPPQKVRSGLAFEAWWVDEKLAEVTDQARRAGME
jgi:microcin C transport system substrate-binding protein